MPYKTHKINSLVKLTWHGHVLVLLQFKIPSLVTVSSPLSISNCKVFYNYLKGKVERALFYSGGG